MSFLRALREREDGSKPRSKDARKRRPQPLVLIFGEFEQKQVVFFLGQGNQSFQITSAPGSIFLSETCYARLRYRGKGPPGQKPKQRSEFGVLLFFQRDFRSSPACLRSQVIRLHLQKSDGNDRGQDRYPGIARDQGLQCKNSGFLLKRRQSIR